MKIHKFEMADIYDKILIFSCSGVYKNLTFVEIFFNFEATEQMKSNLKF